MISAQKIIENYEWEDLWLEAVKCGKLMERGHLSKTEKSWAHTVFAELLKRCVDTKQKETVEKALKVLYYF